MPTTRELADRFLEARKAAWANADPTTAIVSTEQLNPDDEQALRRFLEDAGYRGKELDRVAAQVAALVVGRVEALADDLPATGGD